MRPGAARRVQTDPMSRRTATLLAALLLTAGCQGATGSSAPDAEQSLTLDAEQPEFHGRLSADVLPALSLIGMTDCTPEEFVVCDSEGRRGYRPMADPAPVTVTDATMGLDRYEQYWVVTLTVRPHRRMLRAAEQADEVGGFVTLLLDDRIVVATEARTVTPRRVEVGRLSKPEAYALMDRITAAR